MSSRRSTSSRKRGKEGLSKVPPLISPTKAKASTGSSRSLSNMENGTAITTDGVNLDPEQEHVVTKALCELLVEVDQTSPPLHHTRAHCPGDNDTDEKRDEVETTSQRLNRYFSGICYGLTEGEQRLIMYRTLKAEKFNVSKAVKTLMATVEFRKRQNLNRMVLFPSLVPTRGYNERLVCESLNLPFLEDWQLTATGVMPTPAALLTASHAVGGDGRPWLSRATDLENYYQTSYSEFIDSTPPGSPWASLPVNTPTSPAAQKRRQLALSGESDYIPTAEFDDRAASSCQLPSSASHRPSGLAAHSLSSGDVPQCLTLHTDPNESLSGENAFLEKGEKDLAKTRLSPSCTANTGIAQRMEAQEEQPRSEASHGFFSRFLNHLNPFGSRSEPSGKTSNETAGSKGGATERDSPSRRQSMEGHRRMFMGANRGHEGGLEPGASTTARQWSSNQEEGDTALTDYKSIDDAGETDSALMVDQQTAIFVNTGGVARTLHTGPATCYSEALDFHALLQPIVNVVLRYLPLSIHYWDRQGHPVMYIKLGTLRAKKLVEELFKLTPVSTEPKALALLCHAYTLEVVSQLIRFNDRKNKRDNEIRQALLSEQLLKRGHSSLVQKKLTILSAKEPASACIVVIDCRRVKLKRLFYKPLFQIVKPLVSLDQKHYPNLLHHMYVVNCNSAVTFAYITIRSILSEETRSKITFCTKGNTVSTLKGIIDGDLLPMELGGRCQCPGGCLPQYTGPSDASSVASSWVLGESRNFDGDSTSESLGLSETMEAVRNGVRQKLNCTVEKLKVSPHKKATLTFAVAAHEELFWEFRCKNKRSVEFSVVYIPASAEGGMFSLTDPARVKDGASHYICPDFGTIILEWCNKYSKVHKIDIHAKVFTENSLDTAPLSQSRS